MHAYMIWPFPIPFFPFQGGKSFKKSLNYKIQHEGGTNGRRLVGTYAFYAKCVRLRGTHDECDEYIRH